MLTLTLQSLDVLQFKHHTHPVHYSLFPDTRISGTNGAGKTTLADAVLFTLFGINALGSKQLDSWLPRGVADPALRAAVRLSALDGRDHTIQRERTASGTKIFLDGHAVKQEQLTPLIGTATLFLPAWLPLTFGQWKDTEARDFWTALLPKVAPAHVLLVLGAAAGPLHDWPVEQFEHLDTETESARAALRAHETDVDRILGAMAALQQGLDVPPVAAVSPPDPEPVTRARDALSQIVLPETSPPDWTAYYQTLAACDAQIADASHRRPEGWVDPHPLAQALAAWELRAAQHAATAPREDLTPVQAVRTEYHTLYAQWVHHSEARPRPSLPPEFDAALRQAQAALQAAETAVAVQAAHPVAPPASAAVALCPVCQQPLPPADQARLQAQAESDYATWCAQSDAAAEQQRTAHAHLTALLDQQAEAELAADTQWTQERQTLHHQLTTLSARGQALTATLQQAHATALAAFDATTARLQAEGDRLRAELAAVEAANAALPPLSVDHWTTERATTQAALAAAQAAWAETQARAQAETAARRTQAQAAVQQAETTWQAQQAAWSAYTADQTQRERLTRDLATQSHLLQATRQAIATLKTTLAAMAAYTVTRSELEMQPLLDSLHATRIELWEPLKSSEGERPIFRLTWHDVPFAALSHAERLACTTELTFALAALTGVVRPTFLDNVESCAVIPPVPGQRVTATFVRTPPQLLVEAGTADLPVSVSPSPPIPVAPSTTPRLKPGA